MSTKQASRLTPPDRETSGSAAAFGDIRGAVAQSPLAMVVVSLPDRRIRLVSDPALALFGSDRSTVLRWRSSDLFVAADAAKSEAALTALTSGVLDSYRAQRQLRMSGESVNAIEWVRMMRIPSGPMAVLILVPEGEIHAAHHSIATFFGPDALDLAVGTTDPMGRIEQISPNSRQMLGRDQADLAGRTLTELAHPDDGVRLADALHSAIESGEEGAIRLRMKHVDRGWIEAHCLFFPMSVGESRRMGFVLAGPTAETPVGPGAVRHTQLELHLLRIGAVLKEMGLAPSDPFGAHASRFPALNELSARQREIVDRLLRGERLASIASALYVSPSTVRNHVSHVFEKFGVHSQAELLSMLRSEEDAPPS